jgi:hypothetical protein
MKRLSQTRLLRRGWGRALLLTGVVALVAVGAAAAITSRAAVAPSNSSLPSISGAPTSGSTLTANPGTWNGSAPITFQYQWQQCDANGGSCQNIAGATNQTYTLRSDDAGDTVRVRVIANNADGSAAATSAPSARIAAGSTAPSNTSLPTVTGNLSAGSTLTVNPGTWNGTSLQFTYRWLRCDARGDACADIAGATGQTYQLQRADDGRSIRVRVTARNSGGTTTALSAPSTAVGGGTGSGPNGCGQRAAGATSVPVSSVQAPSRLQVSKFNLVSGRLTLGLQSFSVRFNVTDTCGQPVSGANVYATAVPYNMVSIPRETATDGNGNVTLTFNRMRGYPATPSQRLLVMFVRAREAGTAPLAGISTRRLISFRVNLRG